MIMRTNIQQKLKNKIRSKKKTKKIGKEEKRKNLKTVEK